LYKKSYPSRIKTINAGHTKVGAYIRNTYTPQCPRKRPSTIDPNKILMLKYASKEKESNVTNNHINAILTEPL